MIVPMKKVTVLALADHEEEALQQLRDLGVMHVVSTPGRSDSAEAGELSARLANARRAVTLLSQLDEVGAEAEDSAEAGARAAEQLLTLLEERNTRTKDLQLLERRLKALAPWGDFDGTLPTLLREHRIWVYLLTQRVGTPLKLPESATAFEVNRVRDTRYLAVISPVQLAPEVLPGAVLADAEDPRQLCREAETQRRELARIQSEIEALAASLPAVRRHLRALDGDWDYLQAENAVCAHGPVVSLTGFVPEPEVGRLTAAARSNGWGLLVVDPAEDDRVPTLIRMPKWVKVVDPLFQFLGISPGYNELDASAAVLVFFTIFYAMIVGDAGYGALFLIATAVAWGFLRRKPAARMPLRLMAILSIATIVWGALSGNWFGISTPGLHCLTDPATKDGNVQAFCFMLAIAQLTLGRLWRAFKIGKLREGLGHVGWALILWGNFFLTLDLLVWPGYFPKWVMFSFYGLGLLLVVCCAVDWRDPAGIFQFPFDLIGSFTDVLSYIRLFAVGMAGYYIASSFNGMGRQLIELSPWIIPAAVLVLLAGHLINLALCMMSVLVHGVRLNTLEFSNHIGLQWTGFHFRPFKNTES